MAPKKRALKSNSAERPENNEAESSEEDGNTSDDDDMIDAEVTVDFEARTPDDGDYDGIRRLLQQLFLKAHVNLGELTNEILKQNYVASVVTQSVEDDDEEEDEDDDDEIFGLLTVLNVSEKRRNLECVRQIESLLLDKTNSQEQRKRLAALLEDGSRQVGLLVSERFTNIPPQIALPLYETLQKDMAAARERNLKFDFTDLVMISKIYKRQDDGGGGTRTTMYANEEDSFFCDVSELHYDYSVWEQADSALGGSWDEDDEQWNTFRRVLVFPAARLSYVVDKLRTEMKNDDEDAAPPRKTT